jgi:hypothetical protein
MKYLRKQQLLKIKFRKRNRISQFQLSKMQVAICIYKTRRVKNFEW